MCVYIYILYICVFPKIGVPPNHPFVHRVFHYFHHPFSGTIIFGNTHIMNPLELSHPKSGLLFEKPMISHQSFRPFLRPQFPAGWLTVEIKWSEIILLSIKPHPIGISFIYLNFIRIFA